MQQDASYDQEAERQAQEWIEAITEEPIGGKDFFDGLRDGSHLCRSARHYLWSLHIGMDIYTFIHAGYSTSCSQEL